ncbi:MAG TPA: hypothetical protein PKA64_25905 [Myxococcota bacterium]|nr:hypothetical protein [Myxococcota bacterium]
MRFAPDGSVAWRLDGSFHRDLDVGRDGAIVSLTFEPQHLNNMSREHPTKAEQLAWVTPEGAVQKKLSLLSALVRSPHWHLVEALDVPDGDILHTSSVDLLDDPGPDPAFAAGRVVVTVPVIDAVLVFDPAEEVFPWGIVGDPLHAPQAARLTPGGLLVLDNQSGPSTVRLFDPKTKAELRTFAGSPAVPFATPSAGAVHLLPNRDLLVVSTHEGRATELSPQGQVVWTWQTPYAAAAGRAAPLFDVLPR